MKALVTRAAGFIASPVVDARLPPAAAWRCVRQALRPRLQ